ncbi:NAD(P)-binding protein [Aureobasidium pullulans]|nr:NAD(P)-binding protein [Aureobasidium pullulans]THW79507.1 NAD(P)-binding protein [Aureobasidium pullulans]
MGDTAGSTAATKPNVLIIGGLGYIGRFLTNHIHTNSLASTLRIVDKQLPQLASLAPEHKDACSDNFMQADASRPPSLSRVFDLPDGQRFDYVFNCGGETRHSQDDEVYKLRSYELSLNVAQEAARRGVKAYVELSTGTVYDSKRDPPRKETDKLKPSLKQAKWKLQAEEDLSKIPNLPLVVLRLPNVYGPYSGQWMGTQLALARVYQGIEKELKWLWGPELRTHTVHVDDVVRACWTAADWRANQAQTGAAADSAPPTPTSPTPKKGPLSSASVFNIVDKGDTSQGTMAEITKALFGIETGFQNVLINTFARLNLEHVVDDVNDETLDPWAELQQKAGIDAGTGPLSPFMEKELLREADLCLDGAKFEQTVGFKYTHEKLTKQEVEAVIDSYKRMKWWP